MYQSVGLFFKKTAELAGRNHVENRFYCLHAVTCLTGITEDDYISQISTLMFAHVAGLDSYLLDHKRLAPQSVLNFDLLFWWSRDLRAQELRGLPSSVELPCKFEDTISWTSAFFHEKDGGKGSLLLFFPFY